jgi:PAS domain S-box-containing protein
MEAILVMAFFYFFEHVRFFVRLISAILYTTMRLTLSIKILAVVAIAAGLMIAGMLIYGTNEARKGVEKDTSGFVVDKLTGISREVDTLLANYQSQLEIIRSDPIFGDVLTGRVKSSLLDDRLAQLLVYSGPWEALILLDENKLIKSRASLSGTPGLFPEEEILLDQAQRTGLVYSDAYDALGKTEFSFALPVRTFTEGREKLAGYLVGRIAWRAVEDILSRAEGGVHLMRSDNAIIYEPEGDETTHELILKEAKDFDGTPATMLGAVLGKDVIVGVVQSDGLANFAGNKWRYGGAIDAASLINAARDRTFSMVYVGVSALALLSFVIIIFLRRIVIQPVTSLGAAASRIAAGDFNIPIKSGSSDEIGVLADNFGMMTQQLKELYGSLEKRVKEKTAALETTVAELETSKKQIQEALGKTQNAEEEARRRGEQVEMAFEEVQRFARTADRERLMYSLLISSIGEAVIVMDASRQITVVNGVALRMLGLTTVEEAIGKPISQLFGLLSTDKNQLGDEFLVPVLGGDRPYDLRYFYLKRMSDGVEIPVSGVIAPLTDEKSGGIVRGAIFTLHDVAEEKALEEARISFISTSSHQLRTPLTSMRWFAEMLRDGDAGDINNDQREYLMRIMEGIDRMIGLVNMLLQIARVEAKRVSVEPIPCDLKDIAIRVAATIETQLAEHKQKVQVLAEPDPLPTIMLDKDYPWQVLQNLLTNAQRYSFDDTTIEVNIKRMDGYLQVSVEDHGIGIPKSSEGKLFEKFYRAENALAKVPSGSGLGLSLARELVEEMGGRMWFDSKENVGTTFYFTVPLKGMEARKGEVKLEV